MYAATALAAAAAVATLLAAPVLPAAGLKPGAPTGPAHAKAAAHLAAALADPSTGAHVAPPQSSLPLLRPGCGDPAGLWDADACGFRPAKGVATAWPASATTLAAPGTPGAAGVDPSWQDVVVPDGWTFVAAVHGSDAAGTIGTLTVTVLDGAAMPTLVPRDAATRCVASSRCRCPHCATPTRPTP